VPLDNLILAVGEQPDLDFLPAGHGLPLSERDTILATRRRWKHRGRASLPRRLP